MRDTEQPITIGDRFHSVGELERNTWTVFGRMEAGWGNPPRWRLSARDMEETAATEQLRDPKRWARVAM